MVQYNVVALSAISHISGTARNYVFFFYGTGGICIPTGILLKGNKFTKEPTKKKGRGGQPEAGLGNKEGGEENKS